jgi:hypothetical protein
MKKFLLIIFVLLTVCGYSQKYMDKIIKTNGDTINCQITSINDIYIFFNVQKNNLNIIDHLPLTVVKWYILDESSNPKITKTTFTQPSNYTQKTDSLALYKQLANSQYNAGLELKKAGKIYFIGTGVLFAGAGVAVIGATIKITKKNANGVIYETSTGSLPVVYVGSAICFIGLLTQITAFANIWKSGEIFVKGNQIGINYSF